MSGEQERALRPEGRAPKPEGKGPEARGKHTRGLAKGGRIAGVSPRINQLPPGGVGGLAAWKDLWLRPQFLAQGFGSAAAQQ